MASLLVNTLSKISCSNVFTHWGKSGGKAVAGSRLVASLPQSGDCKEAVKTQAALSTGLRLHQALVKHPQQAGHYWNISTHGQLKSLLLRDQSAVDVSHVHMSHIKHSYTVVHSDTLQGSQQLPRHCCSLPFRGNEWIWVFYMHTFRFFCTFLFNFLCSPS